MTHDNSDKAPFEKKTERLDIRVSHAKKKAFGPLLRRKNKIRARRTYSRSMIKIRMA